MKRQSQISKASCKCNEITENCVIFCFAPPHIYTLAKNATRRHFHIALCHSKSFALLQYLYLYNYTLHTYKIANMYVCHIATKTQRDATVPQRLVAHTYIDS